MNKQNKKPTNNVMGINKLDREIILLHLTTLSRLFYVDPDAALLYLFYCHTAKLQTNIRSVYTNSIKATETYCKKGLKWSSERFHKAKNILLQEKIIEDVVRKSQQGKIIGHYIYVHYLQNHLSSNQRVVLPEDGFQETNTDNKNINTDNKKGTTINKDKDGITNKNYLINIPIEDVLIFHNKYQLTPQKIKIEAERAYTWLGAKGMTYKNYRMYLQNWLSRTAENNYRAQPMDTQYVSVQDYYQKNPLAKKEADDLKKILEANTRQVIKEKK
ncbi:MAG: hypothetical protein AABY22_13490 [Nanoarchaeota archaeon]